MTIATDIELEPATEHREAGKPLLISALPFLDAVKVQVSVRVGGAEVTVAELSKMQRGTVLSLDRHLEEPLDLLVDGYVVARGVLVAVEENFGVRITESVIAGSASAAKN